MAFHLEMRKLRAPSDASRRWPSINPIPAIVLPAVRPFLILLFTTLLLTACGSKLGKPNPEIVGEWKASNDSGGDTWTFLADGTFTAEGGRQKSPTGTGAQLQNLPRTGKWGEKGGVVMLEFMTLTSRERPAYEWRREGARLSLSRPGESAPAIVLDRTK